MATKEPKKKAKTPGRNPRSTGNYLVVATCCTAPVCPLKAYDFVFVYKLKEYTSNSFSFIFISPFFCAVLSSNIDYHYLIFSLGSLLPKDACKSCRSRQELSIESLFRTKILIQTSTCLHASIQPRTSLSKFAGGSIELAITHSPP